MLEKKFPDDFPETEAINLLDRMIGLNKGNFFESNGKSEFVLRFHSKFLQKPRLYNFTEEEQLEACAIGLGSYLLTLTLSTK